MAAAAISYTSPGQTYLATLALNDSRVKFLKVVKDRTEEALNFSLDVPSRKFLYYCRILVYN